MELGGLLVIMTGIIFLWETPIVYPLKVLVVFFHELSHGVAALLTGGSVEEIHIVPEEGGLTVTRGGSEFLILSAGYLGSLAVGGVTLVLASRTRFDREIALAMGIFLVTATALFVRPFDSLGFVFGVIAGAVAIIVSRKLPEALNDFALKLIGLTSCLYAVLDIKDDILDRPGIPSDARMLAEHTGVPTLVWGVVWIAIAVAAAIGFLLLACRPKLSSDTPQV